MDDKVRLWTVFSNEQVPDLDYTFCHEGHFEAICYHLGLPASDVVEGCAVRYRGTDYIVAEIYHEYDDRPFSVVKLVSKDGRIITFDAHAACYDDVPECECSADETGGQCYLR